MSLFKEVVTDDVKKRFFEILKGDDTTKLDSAFVLMASGEDPMGWGNLLHTEGSLIGPYLAKLYRHGNITGDNAYHLLSGDRNLSIDFLKRMGFESNVVCGYLIISAQKGFCESYEAGKFAFQFSESPDCSRFNGLRHLSNEQVFDWFKGYSNQAGVHSSITLRALCSSKGLEGKELRLISLLNDSEGDGLLAAINGCLAGGADPSSPDSEGKTALRLVNDEILEIRYPPAKENVIKTFKLLLKYGAEPSDLLIKQRIEDVVAPDFKDLILANMERDEIEKDIPKSEKRNNRNRKL